MNINIANIYASRQTKIYKFPIVAANINSIGRIYVMQQFISEYHRMTLQASHQNLFCL